MKRDIIWVAEVIFSIVLMLLSGSVIVCCLMNIPEYGVNFPPLIVSFAVLVGASFYYGDLMEV